MILPRLVFHPISRPAAAAGAQGFWANHLVSSSFSPWLGSSARSSEPSAASPRCCPCAAVPELAQPCWARLFSHLLLLALGAPGSASSALPGMTFAAAPAAFSSLAHKSLPILLSGFFSPLFSFCRVQGFIFQLSALVWSVPMSLPLKCCQVGTELPCHLLISS